MTWLLLTAALAMQQAPSGPSPWRVVDRRDLHLGIRPAALVTRGERAAGVTLQLSI